MALVFRHGTEECQGSDWDARGGWAKELDLLIESLKMVFVQPSVLVHSRCGYRPFRRLRHVPSSALPCAVVLLQASPKAVHLHASIARARPAGLPGCPLPAGMQHVDAVRFLLRSEPQEVFAAGPSMALRCAHQC